MPPKQGIYKIAYWASPQEQSDGRTSSDETPFLSGRAYPDLRWACFSLGVITLTNHDNAHAAIYRCSVDSTTELIERLESGIGAIH